MPPLLADAAADILSCLPAACPCQHSCFPFKGLVLYKNYSDVLSDSVFSPSLLSESRMLYFWLSEHILNSLASAAFLDGRLVLTIRGEKLQVTCRAGSSVLHVHPVRNWYIHNKSTLAGGAIPRGTSADRKLHFWVVKRCVIFLRFSEGWWVQEEPCLWLQAARASSAASSISS